MYIPTKEVIRQALSELLEEASMDSITVKAVCERAGVSRQALYNHYYCLGDVAEEIIRSELRQATDGCDTYPVWTRGFHEILAYFQRRKNLLLHLYHSAYRADLIQVLGKIGEFLVQRGILQCEEDIGREIREEDRDFMVHFYLDVFMGILCRYMRGNMAEDPAYITGMCEALMGNHIHNTIYRLVDNSAGM